MRGNGKTDTSPEVALRSVLHRRGLRFRKHAAPTPNIRCQVDILFRSARVAVFVDGCFWHGCPDHGTKPRTNSTYWVEKLARNAARDRLNDAALTGAGWKVIRIWEHEPVEDAAELVEHAVRATNPARRTSPSSVAGLAH
jgi:DNA mismatch endonuclease, patch repair protein